MEEHDERLVAWTREQYWVASQVVVREDPPPESQWIPVHDDLDKDTGGDVGYSWYSDRSSTGKERDDDDDDEESKTELYGGVDVSFPENEGDPAVAVYVVVQRTTTTTTTTTRANTNDTHRKKESSLEVVYSAHRRFALEVPYVSSFLSFREMGPLQSLVEEQRARCPRYTPCVLLVDGNGILHQRRAGIACFLGVRTGIPTIGVAKTLYCHDGLHHDLLENALAQQVQQLARRFRQSATTMTATTTAADKTSGSTRPPPPPQDRRGVIIVDHNPIRPKEEENDKEEEEEDKKKTKTSRDSSSSSSSSSWSDTDVMTTVAQHCEGFAVPMVGRSGTVWGAALVGHGGKMPGQRRGTTNAPAARCRRGGGPTTEYPSQPQSHAAGTKNPIFISIGHDVSLVQAVQICAKLSQSRIPEPVRQADLMGRDLLRRGTTNETSTVATAAEIAATDNDDT